MGPFFIFYFGGLNVQTWSNMSLDRLCLFLMVLI